MLNCREKTLLGIALLIVLIKEKIKIIKDILLQYFRWFCSVVRGAEN